MKVHFMQMIHGGGDFDLNSIAKNRKEAHVIDAARSHLSIMRPQRRVYLSG